MSTVIIHESIASLAGTCSAVAAELAPGSRTIVIDGSMYSPSWRAISALETIFQQTDSDGREYDAIDEINDALDNMERMPMPHDSALYWEDGCLFVERPNLDGEFSES